MVSFYFSKVNYELESWKRKSRMPQKESYQNQGNDEQTLCTIKLINKDSLLLSKNKHTSFI